VTVQQTKLLQYVLKGIRQQAWHDDSASAKRMPSPYAEVPAELRNRRQAPGSAPTATRRPLKPAGSPQRKRVLSAASHVCSLFYLIVDISILMTDFYCMAIHGQHVQCKCLKVASASLT